VVRTGAHLDQFDTPAEVLANPATPFVEAFVGRDRFLRRTGLLTVGDAPRRPAPVVTPDDTVGDACRCLTEVAAAWAVVVDARGIPLGWVSQQHLEATDPATTVEDAGWTPMGEPVETTTVLRTALDAVVGTPWEAATVVDGNGRYLGVVTADGIAAALR
jgi:osmoprotectant transport system ATP-binding protein